MAYGQLQLMQVLFIIGASLSEPHTGQTLTASPAMFICIYLSIYVCMYRTSFRKCPHVLIHWTASILLSVIQFRKFHYVQIIETASIFHLQWATTSMCTLLVQAELANYGYSELSYVLAKLYILPTTLVGWYLGMTRK